MECGEGKYFCHQDQKCKPIPKGYTVTMPDGTLVKEGADVFKSAGCTGCHATKTVINKGSKGRVGPNLAHVASRRDLGAGMMRNSNENGSLNDALLQENLRTWIEDPEQIKPGNLMSKGAQVYTDPDKKLTEEQISQLVHYLSSLK